jgi:hypothetical protein
MKLFFESNYTINGIVLKELVVELSQVLDFYMQWELFRSLGLKLFLWYDKVELIS